MSLSPPRRAGLLAAFVGLLLTTAVPAAAARAVGPPPAASGGAAADRARADPSTVDPDRRDELLPRGWQTSPDVAWTTVGDRTGLHLLAAEARAGYTWRTVATLAEPGVDADQWIGNACLTSSGRRAVVVYAPRTFANKAVLARRGGFSAVVDMATGAVRKLPVTTSLAYFNPGCGEAERAVLTQEGDEDLAATRLLTLDASTGAVGRAVELAGQVTSAVPTAAGTVAAAGRQLVRVGARGELTPLAGAVNVPFDLTVDGAGGVLFTDYAGLHSRIVRVADGRATTLATGELGRFRTARGTGGRVFLTGTATAAGALPAGIARLAVPPAAEISTAGQVAVLPRTVPDRDPGEADAPRPVTLAATVPATGARLDFTLTPGLRPGPQSAGGIAGAPLGNPAGGGPTGPVTAGSMTNPIDDDRFCSVPRNDAATQAYQPTARQVEWATDQAVNGTLTVSRPAGFKRFGLPAYTPQGMFPPIALAGGGRVPAQILLGILAQESNLWQASNHTLSGEFGNPLIGNFYGRPIYDTNSANDWDIDWTAADCGYGVGQVTDGMRISGHAKPGEVLLPPEKQRAVGLDYAANIAAAIRILQTKWNQTYSANLKINDTDPIKIENWFFAVWAYNSGFHPDAGNGSPWGVGWLNNPVNPRYPAFRAPFLELTYDDARTPQKWPYPEKVLGWAGHPIDTVDGAGYRAAWWNTVPARERVKPPVAQFCDSSNECQPGGSFLPTDPAVVGEPAGPCAHKNAAGQYDLLCYYHQPNTWKPDCSFSCGNDLVRFDSTFPEQPDGTHSPPRCDTGGLPAGALIIDDVPTSVAPVRCGGVAWTNSGTFGLTFATDSAGRTASKVDFHQVGGGFGSHFWFAHTRRSTDEGGKLAVTGKWTLNQAVNGWARVLVHMPDHGAHTRQAKYAINLGNGTKFRVLPQRTQEHRWISLGAFAFAGTPSVTLSTVTGDGRGEEDVAWDAIAVQRLAAKPRNFVVAMGDSYSSGEGASVSGGGDYYKESDVDGDDPVWRDACHRSKFAWSRKAVLADNAGSSVGTRADGWEANMDYHMVACSGAQTENLLPADGSVRNAFGESGQAEYGELAQVDQGYLDENTTLVTVSIGGNDARFADIVKQCIYAAGLSLCQDSTVSGDSQPLKDAEPARIRGPVRQSIVIALREIHQRAPNAKVVLMSYPILLDNDGQCVIGIGTAEAPWMAEMGNLMVEQMAGAAADATAVGVPTWISDPRDEFAGEGICGNPETVHGIVVDKTPGDQSGLLPPSSQSFHPKLAGTTHYADSLNSTLRTMGL